MSLNRRKFDWVGGAVIPFSYLLVVLLIDATTARSTITPLFGIIGLLVLSFCLTPRVMTFWAAIYSVTVVAIFMNPMLFHFLNREAPAGDGLTPLVRSATFVVGAIISTLFCRVQYRLNQSNTGLIHMLEEIPSPVITSDQDGRIYFANRSAAVIAGLSAKELHGMLFFDLFADKDRQGATIADYLRRFSSSHIEEPIFLKCRGTTYLGSTRMIDTSSPRLLMIVLSREDVADGFVPPNS
jgi:PAS domain S-box-containing protein